MSGRGSVLQDLPGYDHNLEKQVRVGQHLVKFEKGNEDDERAGYACWLQPLPSYETLVGMGLTVGCRAEINEDHNSLNTATFPWERSSLI